MLMSIAIALLHPLSLYRLVSRDASLAFDATCFLITLVCTDSALRSRLGLVSSWLLHVIPRHYFALSFSLAVALLIRYARRKDRFEAEHDATSKCQFLPPLLFPSRTTHTRFFPEKHSFSYSYLYVGIPVGWKGRCGSLLSADVDAAPVGKYRNGWFNVHADDYLEGRANGSGLSAKLTDYLDSQGVDRAAYSFAYLVTAPRFLGYSFNPVSFWYIYNEHRTLIMMILEVNNTFDERRIYLLKRDQDHGNGGTGTPRFKDTWAKDFHVSPFSSRKGSYSLTATDPLAHNARGSLEVDNVITLKSSQGHVKLVARVHSTVTALSPAEISSWSAAVFLLKYGWIGFMTSPRIVFEASRLFFKRNLHVWFRPEILNTSIGRKPTPEEEAIERQFKLYLQDAVRKFPNPVRLKYIPPTRMAESETMLSPSATGLTDQSSVSAVTCQVLTPAFYSRFVHYIDTLDGLDREGPRTDALNRTIDIDDVSVMRRIIREQVRSPVDGSWPTGNKAVRSGSIFPDGWRWSILQRLRPPVAEQAYPHRHLLRPPGSTSISASDGKASVPSPTGPVPDTRPCASACSMLDGYVRSRRAPSAESAYRRAVTRLFLSERFALGQVWIARLADSICRAVLVRFACAVLRDVCARADPSSAGPRQTSTPTPVSLLGCIKIGLATGLVHAWSVAKG